MLISSSSSSRRSLLLRECMQRCPQAPIPADVTSSLIPRRIASLAKKADSRCNRVRGRERESREHRGSKGVGLAVVRRAGGRLLSSGANFVAGDDEGGNHGP